MTPAEWKEGPEELLKRIEALKAQAQAAQVELVRKLTDEVRLLARLGKHHAKAREKADG